MSRGNKMAPVPHPASKQCQSPTRRRQTTLSHVCVNTHTQTYTQTYAHICETFCLTVCLGRRPPSACLGIYLTFAKASRPQTDARQHVFRLPCPDSCVCVLDMLCVSHPALVALLLPSSCPASSFFVIYLIRFSMHVFSHL